MDVVPIWQNGRQTVIRKQSGAFAHPMRFFAVLGIVLLVSVGCDVFHINSHPVAVISCTTLSGEVPLHVSASATHSYDPNGDALTATWYLDDKFLTAGESASFDFESTGTHAVLLRVEDTRGGVAEDRVEVTAFAQASAVADGSGQVLAAAGGTEYSFRVVDAQAQPIPGVQCAAVSVGDQGVVQLASVSGTYVPRLGGLGLEESPVSGSSAFGTKLLVAVPKDFILHAWDKVVHGGSHLVYDDRLPAGATKAYLQENYKFWRGPVALKELKANIRSTITDVADIGADGVVMIWLTFIGVPGVSPESFDSLTSATVMAGDVVEANIDEQVQVLESKGYTDTQRFEIWMGKALQGNALSVMILPLDYPGKASTQIAPPTAVVSERNITALVGASIVLDGSRSWQQGDPTGTTLRGEWSELAGPTVSLIVDDAKGLVDHFVASTPGDHVFGLVVWSGNLVSEVQSVQVSVRSPDDSVGTPSLTSPNDKAMGQSLMPTLQWLGVTGASKYWVTVATSSGALPTDPNATTCSQCVCQKYTTAVQWAVPSGTLAAGTTYYWCVQGFNDAVTPYKQGQFSEIWSFTTAAETPTQLDAPQLQSPSSGASGQSLMPTLQWLGVTGASKYWVMVATSSGALPTDPNATTCSQCVCQKYTTAVQWTVPSGTLAAGTTYYWCVQGFNDAVTPTRQGKYSEPRSFSTGGGTCTCKLTPSEQPFTNTGGNGSFAVETSVSCAWSPTTDSPSWVTITSAGATGSGAVDYSVAAYSGSTTRTGHITVKDQTFKIAQTGNSPCIYSLSSYSQNYTDSGSHSAGFGVTTGASCSWSAVVESAASSWLSAVASPSVGNGTVTYSITANETSSSRTGRIYVQDKTFTVTQAGRSTPVKELDHVVVSGPAIVNESSSGAFTCTAFFNDGTSVEVTSAATWTQDSPYASVSGGVLSVGSLSGDSSCAVRASYTYNGINKWAFKAVTLKDVVTVLDRLEVTGPAVVNESSSGDFVCTAYFSDGTSAIVTGAAIWTCAPSSSWGPHASTVAIAGGRLSVGALDTDDDWAVTASYTYGTSTKYRGVAVHLHDTTPPPPPPNPCTFEVGPTTAPRVAAQGGSGVICVRTSVGCQWQAVTSDSWIHVTTGTDYAGNGDVGYTVDMNPGSERSGTITAAGRPCTIPQSSSAPPVARLTMSAQGRTAYENGTLNLTIASGQTVTVQLSAARSTVDTGAPNAQWFIDNFIGPGGSETSWDFSTAGTHPVRLDVMNSDGTTASAYAEIAISISP